MLVACCGGAARFPFEAVGARGMDASWAALGLLPVEAVGRFGMETGREARESIGMEAAFLPVLRAAF